MKDQLSTYYRARLAAQSMEGLSIVFDEWKSFKESECYSWCVNEFQYSRAVMLLNQDGALLKDVKKVVKVKRIDKRHSRFAQKTKDDAIENLRFRKRHQINHLKRELEFAMCFISKEDSDINNVSTPYDDYLLISGTSDLVQAHYVFD